MDVFAVGMFRACSTWQYEVACDLIERRGGCRRLGYATAADYRRAGADSRPTVLKSHDYQRPFARALRAGRARALYAHRDLRDVADSLAHKRGESIEALVRGGVIHQTVFNDRSWRAEPNLLVQRYDDLTAEPARGVAEIAGFLGIDLADGEADAVAAAYSPAANRRRAAAVAQRLRADGDDPADPAHQLRFDPHSLLHWNHLRDGSGGGWRDRLSARELALIAAIAAPWLSAQGYEPDDSWAAPLGTDGLAWPLAHGRANAAAYRASFHFPRLAALTRRLRRRAPAVARAVAPAAVTPAAAGRRP